MRDILSIAAIKRLVAAEFGLSIPDLMSRRSERAVARPRQVAMWIARHEARAATLPKIAREFGRDHKTVMAGIRRIDTLIASDAAFAARVRQCSEGASS